MATRMACRFLAGLSLGGLGYNTFAACDGTIPGVLSSRIPQLVDADFQATPPAKPPLLERLMKVNTAAICDADKEGIRVMDERLRPIGPTKKVPLLSSRTNAKKNNNSFHLYFLVRRHCSHCELLQ